MYDENFTVSERRSEILADGVLAEIGIGLFSQRSSMRLSVKPSLQRFPLLLILTQADHSSHSSSPKRTYSSTPHHPPPSCSDHPTHPHQ